MKGDSPALVCQINLFVGNKMELVDLIEIKDGKIGSFTPVNQGHALKYKKKKPFRPSPSARLDHALCGIADPFSTFVEDGRTRATGAVLVEASVLGLLIDLCFLCERLGSCA